MAYFANMNRVKRFFRELGDLSIREEDGGYTRLAFSEQEKAAQRWLVQNLRDSGCSVEQDSVGNVLGRYGTKEGASIAFGSHLDTVPHGGLFDGALGVIAGLECMHLFSENQLYPDVPLELICFTGEESNPLGGTFGSRSMAGLIEGSEAYKAKLGAYGFSWTDVLSAQKSKKLYLNFLELHIEQGNVLETYRKKIGIPTAIAGMLRLSVAIHGRASHAGTTPMVLRKDALVQASLLVSEVNRIARDTNGGIVATVGELHVFPNVPSVVPGEVRLVIEIRGINWEKVKHAEQKIKEWLELYTAADVIRLVEKFPCKLSASLQNIEEEVCEETDVPYFKMFSGANHDSNAMSTLTETAMLFVPSKDGVSHHPAEYTSWDDIETGINTLMRTLIQINKKYKKIKTER